MNRRENHEKDHFNFISLRYGCVFFVCLFLWTVEKQRYDLSGVASAIADAGLL